MILTLWMHLEYLGPSLTNPSPMTRHEAPRAMNTEQNKTRISASWIWRTWLDSSQSRSAYILLLISSDHRIGLAATINSKVGRCSDSNYYRRIVEVIVSQYWKSCHLEPLVWPLERTLRHWTASRSHWLSTAPPVAVGVKGISRLGILESNTHKDD
jgi:hypothetical protein